MEMKDVLNITGTPAYVFSEDAFAKRAKAVKDILGDQVDLCFSMKANPFMLKCLPETFSKVEVCSPGELNICKALNIPWGKIIFSGVNKSQKDVDDAMAYGADVITCESLNHVKYADVAGQKFKLPHPVILRLADESQFGIDAEEFISIVKRRAEFKGIEIRGIHFFTGTQKRKAKEIKKEIDYLIDFIGRLKDEADFEVQVIEYGPGLDVQYFEGKEEPEEYELNLLNEVAPEIQRLCEYGKVTVEMGRFFASSCGTYFTRVVDTKVNQGTRYAIVDGGLHQLHYDGQFMGMKVPFVSVISDGKETEVHAGDNGVTICGSLCTTQDVLVRGLDIPDLKEGDVLAFKKTGAYSAMEGMSLFLSRDIPGIYLETKGGEIKMLREGADMWKYNMPGDIEE